MSDNGSEAIVQIGRLLTSAGMISEVELNLALDKARERQIPVGTAILMLGLITASELRAAVEAQALVNDKVLIRAVAASALISVHAKGISLPEALQELCWQAEADIVRNRLGELLLAAHMVNEEKLNQCLLTALDTAMPLGRVLVFKKALSDKTLLAVLSAQKMIREGLVSREQAIKGLVAVQRRKITLEESLTEGGFYKPPSKRSAPLGYLLAEAGLLDDQGLMSCMELSLKEEKPLGTILVEQNHLSQKLIDAVLKLQRMIENGTVSRALAIRAIGLVRSDDCSVSLAVAKLGLPKLKGKTTEMLSELLVLSGLISARQAQDICRDDYNSFEDLTGKLVGIKGIDENIVHSGARAIHLIEHGYMTVEDAAIILHYCHKHQLPLDDALASLGWTQPITRKGQVTTP